MAAEPTPETQPPERKRLFFDRYALIILMVVFFFVPFGMRGARMAINNMRNEVKDWLPDSFEETEELAVFREYFWGEGFLVVSWDGCAGLGQTRRPECGHDYP